MCSLYTRSASNIFGLFESFGGFQWKPNTQDCVRHPDTAEAAPNRSTPRRQVGLEKINSFRRNGEIIAQSPEKRGCFQNKPLKINYLCEFQK